MTVLIMTPFFMKALDRLHHVLVVASEAINPTNHQCVTTSEKIEQPLALLTLCKPRAHPAHPMVRNHTLIVDDEACLASLRELVSEGLI